MRGVLLVLLAGCLGSSDRPVEPTGYCRGGNDGACDGSDVCARNSYCYAASEVRSVQVTWTVAGEAPDADTCRADPDLRIDFQTEDYASSEDSVSFAPVPCAAGKFSIDKLPVSFVSVHLGNGRLGMEVGTIDSKTGALALDLRP